MSFFHLIDHLFILRAIILRDLMLSHQRVGRIGFLIEFIMPTVVIILHYYVFSALNRFMPAGIPVELFVLGGFPVWFACRNTIGKVTKRGEGGLGVLLLPGISQIHFLLATAVWECASMVLVLYAGIVFAELLGGDEPLPDVVGSLPPIIIAAALGTGYRLVFEAFSGIWPLVKGVKKVFVYLMFLTSGIYYTGKPGTQDILTEVSVYNPLFHIIATERHALWRGYPIGQIQISVWYSVAWAAGLIAVGLIVNRRLRPWLHK